MDTPPANDPAGLLGGLEVLDAVGLLVVGVLVVLGLARGLWWQVVRLVGVAVAVALARTWDQDLAARISARWPELAPRLGLGIAWLSLFLVGLSVAAVFGRMGSNVLEALRLGLVNRVAGAAVGAATGILLHVVLVIGLCQFAPQAFLARHVAGTLSEDLLRSLAVERRIVLGAESGSDLDGTMRRATGTEPASDEPATPGANEPDPAPTDETAGPAPVDDRPRVR